MVITGSFRIHFDKLGGLSSWKFIRYISTILNEVTYPRLCHIWFGGVHRLCWYTIFIIVLLCYDSIFILLKSLRGPPFPCRKKREKGVMAALHMPTNMPHIYYLAAPQSVRVFIFYFIWEFRCIHFLE